MTSSTSGEQDRTAGTAPSDGAAIPSAYALASSRIDNLGQALTMLGLNATLSLALGFSMVHGVRTS